MPLDLLKGTFFITRCSVIDISSFNINIYFHARRTFSYDQLFFTHYFLTLQGKRGNSIAKMGFERMKKKMIVTEEIVGK